MGSHIKIDLVNEAVSAVDAIAVMTDRRVEDVVCDALRTYEWVLREQTVGRKVVSVNGKPDDETELENFVVNKQVALSYFKDA
jgi:hypothetical protein